MNDNQEATELREVERLQPLFDYMSENHRLTLLHGEMHGLESVVLALNTPTPPDNRELVEEIKNARTTVNNIANNEIKGKADYRALQRVHGVLNSCLRALSTKPQGEGW